MGKSDNTAREIVMRELAEMQFNLFGYICALTGNSQDARDILQDTNVRIWEEAERYDKNRPFMAWAKTMAVYEIMTYRKRKSRERLVFDDDVFASVVDQAETHPDATDAALAHLDGCVAKLPPTLRHVVEQRYMQAVSVKEVARELGRSATAVSLLLMRARQALAACVQQAMAKEGLEA